METNQLTVCSTQIFDQATDTLAIDVDPMSMIGGTILCSQQQRVGRRSITEMFLFTGS